VVLVEQVEGTRCLDTTEAGGSCYYCPYYMNGDAHPISQFTNAAIQISVNTVRTRNLPENRLRGSPESHGKPGHSSFISNEVPAPELIKLECHICYMYLRQNWE